jgi:hypothetical protein
MASTATITVNQIQAIDTVHMRLPSTLVIQPNSSQNVVKRQKFKLEPIKILEPSNKKLNLPEAQRLMCILDELIKKVEMLDLITYLTTLNERQIRELIKKHLSDDEKQKNYESMFVSMFLHHKNLVESYEKGHLSLNGSSQTKESMELLIKMSCKDIIRALSLKPILYESVKLKNSKENELVVYLSELKDLMNERLLTTPNEQREKIDYMRELIAREKSNKEIIKKLREEQSQVLADKDKDVK